MKNICSRGAQNIENLFVWRTVAAVRQSIRNTCAELDVVLSRDQSGKIMRKSMFSTVFLAFLE
ncbi:MAG: hypothetical protein WC707_02010 [Candidatus Babeliaceae bacterium]